MPTKMKPKSIPPRVTEEDIQKLKDLLEKIKKSNQETTALRKELGLDKEGSSNDH